MPDALTFHDLTLGYDLRTPRIVAEGLCGTLATGTLTALTGENGSGKSTLLRTLAGLQRPLAGSVSLLGRDFYALPARERARMLTLVLTPKDAPASLRVHEVVRLGRTPYASWFRREEKAKQEAVVERALRLCDALPLSERSYASLSDGERQRVRLAAALAQETPVILLDEPTAFLDYASRRRLFALLRRLVDEEGKTILFSTHDVPLLAEYGTARWELQHGQLLTL